MAGHGFRCPACGKRYKWKAELGGRTVRCRCGESFVVKQQAGADDSAETVPAVEAEATGTRMARPGTVLAYRGRKPAEAGDSFSPERFKDLYMPLYCLAGGVVVDVLGAWLTSPGGGPAAALVETGVGMVLSIVLMLVAVPIAAHFRQIELGSFSTLLLKLAAIAVAPSAAGYILHVFLRFIPLGGVVEMAAVFCLYFALIGVFFDLDQSDTWYIVMVMFVLHVALVLGVVYYHAR